jgi:NMD protein affecting ribosome stability and mRNA decay
MVYNDKRPPKSKDAKTRPCLSCGKPFKSEWIGNRLCDNCKARNDYKAQSNHILHLP